MLEFSPRKISKFSNLHRKRTRILASCRRNGRRPGPTETRQSLKSPTLWSTGQNDAVGGLENRGRRHRGLVSGASEPPWRRNQGTKRHLPSPVLWSLARRILSPIYCFSTWLAHVVRGATVSLLDIRRVKWLNGHPTTESLNQTIFFF